LLVRQEQRKDMKRIERYSDKKRITKPGPEYSTLYPDTSSDSPSEKSKGERLVSAKTTTKRISTRCKKTKSPQEQRIENRPKLENKQNDKSKSDKQTSYEMHWARERVPPRIEYLELEPQPAAKRAYTEKDIQIRTLSSE